MARNRLRRFTGILLLLFGLGAVLLGRPVYLWTRAWLLDRPAPHDLPPGYVDDASRMNSTRVAETWSIPPDPSDAEPQLRALLQRAREQKLSVAIGGARHSMGGHTTSPEGIVIDMLPLKQMTLNADKQLLTVGAGARWAEIIPFLDAQGLSVQIMQSNHTFSVGGSISVNCHGWQHNRPPIASTVESFRIMLASGEVVQCSRDENAELFSLTLGGYGLFGVILDVTLRVVPNERYRPEVEILPVDHYAARYVEKIDGSHDIGMVYGRLCVTPGEQTFLREAILTVFRRAPCKRDEIPAMRPPTDSTLRREVYRAQIGSDAGKEYRWRAEKALGEQFSRSFFSRNQLLNEDANIYQDRNTDRADILHEYFVPPKHLAGFLEKAAKIISKHRGDLLNVTVRNVRNDRDTFLRYADRDMFALVMLFNQARTPNADSQMEVMTQELIDAALAVEGCYYLPYRLHATIAQFQRAYPQANAFFEGKRRYDPEELFQNQFYRKYGRSSAPVAAQN